MGGRFRVSSETVGPADPPTVPKTSGRRGNRPGSRPTDATNEKQKCHKDLNLKTSDADGPAPPPGKTSASASGERRARGEVRRRGRSAYVVCRRKYPGRLSRSGPIGTHLLSLHLPLRGITPPAVAAAAAAPPPPPTRRARPLHSARPPPLVGARKGPGGPWWRAGPAVHLLVLRGSGRGGTLLRKSRFEGTGATGGGDLSGKGKPRRPDLTPDPGSCALVGRCGQ